jgi:hypothetical protein
MEQGREKVAYGMAETALRSRRQPAGRSLMLKADRRQWSAALLGRWEYENGSGQA